MTSPVTAISYLTRAQALELTGDEASLIYAALELRCGVEARLREHAAVAVGVSKKDARRYEIGKLGRTVENAFGLHDELILLFVTMEDGRACEFLYAPVTRRLQDIAKCCGDYLHAMQPERLSKPDFWPHLRGLVREGCNLLQLACGSEILRPVAEQGFHFALRPDDPRIQIIQDLRAGVPGTFSVATLAPAGPMTFYPADDPKPSDQADLPRPA